MRQSIRDRLSEEARAELDAIDVEDIATEVFRLRTVERNQMAAAIDAHARWSELSKEREQTTHDIEYLKERLADEL